MQPPTPAGAAPPRPLSAQLAELQAALAERSLTLREILAALSDRAYELLILLLVLPFIAPVSVPGMSTPLGLAVAALAGQLAVGRLPWLPRRLLDRRMPAGFFRKVFAVTGRIVRFLEKFLRMRATLIATHPWLRRLHLLAVALAGLVLALPLPIPLSNTFPAWTILALTAGLLARDGLFILFGYGLLVVSIVYIFLLGAAADRLVEQVRHWLGA